MVRHREARPIKPPVQPTLPPPLLSNSATLLAYGKDPHDNGRNTLALDLVALNTTGNIRVHPTRDVALIKIGITAGAVINLVNGVTSLSKASSGILGVSLANLERFTDVLVANEVCVFGYPRSLCLAQLAQLDPDRPLLRQGIVAGTNPAQHSIIIDCPLYPGNSGGPVLEVQDEGLSRRFKVIGLVSKFVPFVETWVETLHGWTNHSVSNSGYSIVVPSDFILELLGP